MKRFYVDADIARWDTADKQSIPLHLAKLEGEVNEKKIDFHLGMLAGSYHMQGMTFIAQSNFDAAVQAFRASADARCKMYERFEMGKGRALEAGHFQSVLVAFVTKDQALVSRLAAHYRADDGTPDSVYLGRALKLLEIGDIEGTKAALAQKKPRFEPQFVGYADCLEAISHKDQQRFVSALSAASESWAKWASTRVKGLPDSACFIQGIGLVRLAERVLGNSIAVSNEFMPQKLLR